MGSNWLYNMGAPIDKQLAITAINKTAHSMHEIASNIRRMPKANLLLRIIVPPLYIVYRRIILPLVSKDLKVDNAHCTMCEKCIKECPTCNIFKKRGRLAFKWNCISCMKCLYSCPQDAISYRVNKPLKLKSPYLFKRLEKIEPMKSEDWVKSKTYRSFQEYFENIAK